MPRTFFLALLWIFFCFATQTGACAPYPTHSQEADGDAVKAEIRLRFRRAKPAIRPPNTTNDAGSGTAVTAPKVALPKVTDPGDGSLESLNRMLNGIPDAARLS